MTQHLQNKLTMHTTRPNFLLLHDLNEGAEEPKYIFLVSNDVFFLPESIYSLLRLFV